MTACVILLTLFIIDIYNIPITINNSSIIIIVINTNSNIEYDINGNNNDRTIIFNINIIY